MIEAEDVRLVADDLVIDEDAVLDEIPALRLDAFVVEADRAERAGLRLVGEDGAGAGVAQERRDLRRILTIERSSFGPEAWDRALFEDFLASDVVMAEQRLVADLDVFEILHRG